MILEALQQYYERKRGGGDIAPPGFESGEIPFILVIDTDGRLRQIDDTRTDRAASFQVPQSVKRSSGVAAGLLWDNAEYVLGLVREDGKPERVLEQHKDFVDRVAGLARSVDDIGLNAVLRFLAADPLAQVEANPDGEKLRRGNPNLAFRLLGDPANHLVFHRPALVEALTKLNEHTGDEKRFCLVSGNADAIARLHPAIKGVWGAQTSGANIVSFNLDAFSSFGKTQNHNAPVGEQAADAYTKALNHLLRRESQQRMQVGDASTVFWSDKSTVFEDDFAALFGAKSDDDPDRGTEAVRRVLAAPKSGVYLEDESDSRFFVLGLSPNAARLSVRFWHAGPISAFVTHLRNHFLDVAIDRPGFASPHLPLWRLLSACAVQGENKNVAPNLAGDTMRAVLTGTEYPAQLFHAAIRRCRVLRNVTHPLAAIIKASLNRQRRIRAPFTRELTMSLDYSNVDPAYRLGRLFAALERVQAAAQPDINATIRERYYGAASSAPASVFPILMRLKNHHLAKLDQPGLKIWFEKLLAEIFSGVAKQFPARLDLPAQGRFAIGYYHQNHEFFRSRSEDKDTDQGESA